MGIIITLKYNEIHLYTITDQRIMCVCYAAEFSDQKDRSKKKNAFQAELLFYKSHSKVNLNANF